MSILFISHNRDDARVEKNEKTMIQLQCPVHGGDLVIERVAAWHGVFSPQATKEWWERAAEAKRMFPHAMPFPAQSEDPDVKQVSRQYCPACREGYERHMQSGDGNAVPNKHETLSK